MQGLGQAAEDPSEITLRYLTGQAKLFLAGIGGLGKIGKRKSGVSS